MSRNDLLKNKIALVTGGSRGIGAAIVRRLVADGAIVAFTYHKSAEAAKTLVTELSGDKVRAYLADAADLENVAALVEKVTGDLGPIDILVNNAGVLAGGLIGAIDRAAHDHMMRVNVEAVVAMTNEVAKTMPDGGRIVNIGSCLGERGMSPGINGYVASKFAVSGLTRAWAHDLAPRKILVNAVLPGPTATDMNPADSDMAKGLIPTIPLRRYAQPAEIASVVAFLAGPDASYVTGHNLTVDGGINA